ncbi:hypothetical protein THRCLA_03584 [Thraustotheca clavata]|uniref:Uncharacterized protein n=1 Tax=Thraustotheca clavata TaxID=74557 RepID=A0A1W0A1V4_9STRA|nr:hypothetical protein THRCLA_03584 [Thraustotheca clavata]
MNILIVEAEGVFEGHRRARVQKGETIDGIWKALEGVVGAELHSEVRGALIFDTNVNSFVPLTESQQVESHARILIIKRTCGVVAAIASRGFNYAFDQGEFKIHGHQLYIEEVGNSGKGTGLTIWDGSIVLAKYLEQQDASSAHNVYGKGILELGAGTGLVGLAAAFCGASNVLLTDLDYTLTNLQHNIDLNRNQLRELYPTQTVSTIELDWFTSESIPNMENIEIILGSDIVWVETLIPSLVATIKRLLQSTPTKKNRLMLLSHQTRSTASDELFFNLLAQANLTSRQLDVSLYPHNQAMSSKIRLFAIHA